MRFQPGHFVFTQLRLGPLDGHDGLGRPPEECPLRTPETLARRSRKHSCYLNNSDVNVVSDSHGLLTARQKSFSAPWWADKIANLKHGGTAIA